MVFIKYFIKDFYPSIKKKKLSEALLFAKDFVNLKPKDIKIIPPGRKSVLFHGGEVWVNNFESDYDNVAQGSYDELELLEVEGI